MPQQRLLEPNVEPGAFRPKELGLGPEKWVLRGFQHGQTVLSDVWALKQTTPTQEIGSEAACDAESLVQWPAGWKNGRGGEIQASEWAR